MRKTRFFIMLENYENHKEEIEKGPYVRQMDLAITCHQLVIVKEKEMYTCHVTWDLLHLWDLSPEKLFEQAGEDSRMFLPPVIEPLCDVIKRHMADNYVQYTRGCLADGLFRAEEDYSAIFGAMEDVLPRLYVVSNTYSIEGASVVYYTDVLREFAQRLGCDLVMLPSSIHEWLVLPAPEAGELKDLEAIVRDANQLVVRECEILSNNVYRYSLKNDKIEMWSENEA